MGAPLPAGGLTPAASLPPSTARNAPRTRVLVPGSGLGRHAWELALRGYDAVGCERAMMMLVVCRYVLNHLLPSGQSAVICPHIHEVSFFSLAFFFAFFCGHRHASERHLLRLHARSCAGRPT